MPSHTRCKGTRRAAFCAAQPGNCKAAAELRKCLVRGFKFCISPYKSTGSNLLSPQAIERIAIMYHHPRDSSIKALTVIRSKSRSVKRSRPQSDDQERTHNQQQCSLLNLPAELRLQIWEYIAPYNKAIRIYGSGLTVRCFICEGPMFESVQKLPKWPRDPLHRGDPCVNCGRSSSGRYLPETPPEASKEGWRGFPTLLVLCRLM